MIIEPNYICVGGTDTTPDVCTACSDGYSPNTDKDTCETVCGDGFRAGTEVCDDGNTDPSDGCATDCTAIDTGFVCSGGSPTTPDTCTECTTGYYQNTDKDTCVSQCGDGLRTPEETCDDNNTTPSDGCSADCMTIDAGYICTGGSISGADTCTECTDGLYPNTEKDTCEPTCGDGLRAGSEVCDDGNTDDSDGCNMDCTSIEDTYICTGGTTSSADTCSTCPAGLGPNLAKDTCDAICGDGLRTGSEVCDDANTDSSDGCAADCTSIDATYICTGGSETTQDTCSTCDAGYEPNDAKDACVPICGDGLRVGTEVCDDQNTSDSDGCNATCDTIEATYICTGGSSSGKDTCTQCSAGTSPNAEKDTCEVICGDGLRAGAEVCDDSNIDDLDGCSSDCSTIEANFVCSGGTTSSADTCTECTDGFSPNGDKDTCITTCGDGFRAGTEVCDDSNTDSSDGCATDCTAIDANYICSGGSPTTADTCTACDSGFEPNTDKDTCVPICGDGLRVGDEV